MRKTVPQSRSSMMERGINNFEARIVRRTIKPEDECVEQLYVRL